MIIDFLKSREEALLKRKVSDHNQRLAKVLGKQPSLASNPTALRLMMLSREEQDGRA